MLENVFQVTSNNLGQKIPYLNGKSLCSFKRPISEAINWFNHYDFKNKSEVCVLGYGGGYHIKYLLLMYPHIKVKVYDFNSDIYNLIDAKDSRVEFKLLSHPLSFSEIKELQNYISDKMPYVVSFRPGWQNFEETYSLLLLKITQREAKVLQESFESQQFNLSLNWDDLYQQEKNNFLSLKHLLENSDSLSTYDEKVLHVFDEILR